MSERWFLSRDAQPHLPRVYCFAHAGGNPRGFLDWQPALDGYAQLVAMCPPGRDHRAGEPAYDSVTAIADGAADAIRAAADDRPVYLFGHSLGALVAFEVARWLRDLDTLTHLVASGCNAPSRVPSPRAVQTARLEGRAFAEAMRYFGGMPPELVADEDLRRLLLPGLHADFRLVAEYAYRPAAPLGIGISLLNGSDDPHVKAAGLEPWRREATAAPVYHWSEGGHFYFEQRRTAVTDVLLALVRDGADAVVPVGHHVELI